MDTTGVVRIEALTGKPEFLSLSAWSLEGVRWEIAGRQRLDSRAIVPWFVHNGEAHVGLLHRERPSRSLRGANLWGMEAIGLDFRGVDEAGDILRGNDELLRARTGLAPDDDALQIPLPSIARSIGYLSELALPLLLPVKAPGARELALQLEDGRPMRLEFLPVREALARFDDPNAPPCAEDLRLLVRALRGVDRPTSKGPERDPSVATAQRWWAEKEKPFRLAADRVLEREESRLVRAQDLRPSWESPRGTREANIGADALRFLRAHRLQHRGQWHEIVAPSSAVALTLLPYLKSSEGNWFLLWNELRPAALERQARAPIFDLPVSARHVNATGVFLEEALAARVRAYGLEESDALEAKVPSILSRVLGGPVQVRKVTWLGRAVEPAPALSSELKLSIAVELDASSLPALPADALLIEARELAHAVAEGHVRDPVVAHALLRLGADLTARGGDAADPFTTIRRGAPAARREFLAAMTSGSEVQKRLRSYSSIEGEQLQSETYARLMTLLQHEHGLRIAYPKTEKDRGFFKAAFRVFMAAERGDEDRALQGLHWSHDAFHFALGNFIVPPPPDFTEWYVSGAPAPAEQPPEGPAWDRYSRALKAAENEATFFSFWTLYAEHLPLARHVGKLTYWEALRDLGITDRAAARDLYDAIVDRAELPAPIARHPVYLAREDIRGLFQYMLGFRAYHFKDIAIAWRFATRDPYRGYLARFGIYESDETSYVAHVKTFCERLAKMQRGLNPLLCAISEVKLDVALRVWDVTKALRLLRAATLAGQTPEAQRDRRARILQEAEPFLTRLQSVRDALAALRHGVADAELSALSEATYAECKRHHAAVEELRADLWDWVAAQGLLTESTIHDERARELPR
ncbi:MAG: hypothetical protein JST92_11840 [Deltaproteobacteria bacterium]|nr:hypothetical protein [Deltaproteobacteria bacterium]